MEHPFFPLFVDLSEKNVLVVGAGHIASRRAAAILPFAGRVTVVAPEVSPSLEELADGGRIALLRRGFQPEDLEDAQLVLTATGDSELDKTVVTLCRERHIPVNAASDKTLCDFHFPGLARRENIVVGVNAGGTDHKAARPVTEKIREFLRNDD